MDEANGPARPRLSPLMVILPPEVGAVFATEVKEVPVKP